jgi:hypothetical protein
MERIALTGMALRGLSSGGFGAGLASGEECCCQGFGFDLGCRLVTEGDQKSMKSRFAAESSSFAEFIHRLLGESVAFGRDRRFTNCVTDRRRDYT